MKWFERLKPMTGRLAMMTEGEAELIAECAAESGDYVEIGCLWGGTALIAALSKLDAKASGDVYTIDPMSGGLVGYAGSNDPDAPDL